MTLTSARPPAPAGWHAHPYNRARYYRAAALAARLPRRARAWLGPRIVAAVRGRFPAERTGVRRNLAQIHPDRAPTWLEAATDRVLANFALCFGDLLALNHRPPSRLGRVVAGWDDQAPTRAALAREGACVSLTAHLGNWDLAGRALSILGRPVRVVMAPEADPAVEGLLERGRAPGLTVTRLTGPLVAVELVAALRRGEIVAFQLDRALGGRGDVEVPFFGQPAAFPLGPFLVAAAAGVPVVPAFCVLEAPRGYRLHVEPAMAVARGAEREALRHAVAVLERYVRAHWDQWFNFYDVWSASR